MVPVPRRLAPSPCYLALALGPTTTPTDAGLLALIAYCLSDILLIAYCLSPIACFLFPIVYCVLLCLPIAHRLKPIALAALLMNVSNVVVLHS